MRCRNHYTDLSSSVGVCASCLRQRLFPLAVAQGQTQTLDEQKHNSETNPDPVFPRSVSPYISRRKTDNSAASSNNQHNSGRNRHCSIPDRRFFRTPEVAPIAGSYKPCEKKKHRFIRFSLLSNLFRSKKRNEPKSSVCDSNHRGSSGGEIGDDNATSAMSSPFWFISNIKSGGDCPKKQPVCFSQASTAARAGVARKQYCSDRGMSPVRYSDCDGAEDEFYGGSIGYETCESRKQTPAHPSVWRGGGKNVSGLSFCLSPLVRVSPCRNWKQKGVAPVDCGEIRVPVKPHLSNTKRSCANRSRKVADFGRFDTSR